jgi:hypothetical protein
VRVNCHRDHVVINIAAFLRSLGVGLMGVALGNYLSRIGFSAFKIGAVVAIGLAGFGRSYNRGWICSRPVWTQALSVGVVSSHSARRIGAALYVSPNNRCCRQWFLPACSMAPARNSPSSDCRRLQALLHRLKRFFGFSSDEEFYIFLTSPRPLIRSRSRRKYRPVAGLKY